MSTGRLLTRFNCRSSAISSLREKFIFHCSRRAFFPCRRPFTRSNRNLSDGTFGGNSCSYSSIIQGSLTDIQPRKGFEVSKFISGLQAKSANEAADARVIWYVLPYHLHCSGVVRCGELIKQIVEMATVAANRCCSRQELVVGSQPASCSLKSVDELKLLEPLLMNDLVHLKADIVTKSDSTVTVKVSVDRSFALNPGIFTPTNVARLTFEVGANNHEVSSPLSQVPGQFVPSKLEKEMKSETASLFGSSSFLYQPYCGIDHNILMMEEYGLIMASRLTRHEAVMVHLSDIKLLRKPEIGWLMSVSYEVVSTENDVLTMFLKVDAIQNLFLEMPGFRSAEGMISYAPINSQKEPVPIDQSQIPTNATSISSKAFRGVDKNVVGNYLSVLKTRSSRVFVFS